MSEIGAILHKHVEELFPVCRSITGQGLRATLGYIERHIPLNITEVPTGTRVLDWTVPPEWNVRGATLKTLSGHTIVDFARHNLHLMNYSIPFKGIVSRAELNAHLHSLPEQPDVVPYVTSYYQRTWGFCLAHRDRISLKDDAYQVEIDTEIAPGSLSYGECALPGEDDGEVLISAHVCHPSLANDNLSSVAVAIELAKLIASRRRRLTWRFLFAPGTIGAISWLAHNPDASSRIQHGLVLTCLGDTAPPTYKRSRRHSAPVDRSLSYILRAEGHGNRIIPFSPTGYDERQFCSPGFNLPMGCLMRSGGGTFPQYHTSADDLDFVKPEALSHSLRVLSQAVDIIEGNLTYKNQSPYGEPHFASRGFMIAGDRMALLWVLSLADGQNSLLDIAERSEIPFGAIADAATRLLEAGLLQRC